VRRLIVFAIFGLHSVSCFSQGLDSWFAGAYSIDWTCANTRDDYVGHIDTGKGIYYVSAHDGAKKRYRVDGLSSRKNGDNSYSVKFSYLAADGIRVNQIIAIDSWGKEWRAIEQKLGDRYHSKNGLIVNTGKETPTYSKCNGSSPVDNNMELIAKGGSDVSSYDPFADTDRLIAIINDAAAKGDVEAICSNGNLYLNALANKGQSNKKFEGFRDRACNIVQEKACKTYNNARARCASALNYNACMDNMNIYSIDRTILSGQCAVK